MSARWLLHKRAGEARKHRGAGLGRTSTLAAVTLAALGFAAALPPSSRAQMQLPGTVNGGGSGSGSDGGSGGSSAAPSAYAPSKPVVLDPPGEGTIAGHPLSHDGTKGEMVFDRVDADKAGPDRGASDKAGGLALSKLTLAGDKISKPGQACTVDVALISPMVATAAGRPAGAIRYAVPLPACPFSIDILDGAVLATSATPSCAFAAADCRGSVGGLWGPHAADITPKRAKELERERTRLETTMRTNFRALLRKAGKDKAAVKSVAREQAAFSSEREMTCRDYDGETAHGFC